MKIMCPIFWTIISRFYEFEGVTVESEYSLKNSGSKNHCENCEAKQYSSFGPFALKFTQMLAILKERLRLLNIG